MCISCLSLQILPHFGWQIRDKNILGPGSVFQGYFVIDNSTDHNIFKRSEKIKIIFSSNEGVVFETINPGMTQSRRRTIFTVQSTVWDFEGNMIAPPLVNNKQTFTFTIQIPMIQFPPATMDHPNYDCKYMLVAVIGMKNGSRFETEIPIMYMPFTETRLLTTPTIVTNTATKDQKFSAGITLANEDFMPGDSLALKVKLKSPIGAQQKRQNRHIKIVTLIVELIQTTQVSAFDDMPDQERVIASNSKTVSMIMWNNDKRAVEPLSFDCVANIGLQLPEDLTPSFRGNMVTLSYNLCVRVEQEGTSKMIRKSRQASKLGSVPVKIGILRLSLPVSNTLEDYRRWDIRGESKNGNVRRRMPLPEFVYDYNEYEETLPSYDESSSSTCNVPPYDEEISQT